MLRPQLILLDIALTFLCAAAGAGGAWLLRRRSSLSIRNLYPAAALAFALIAAAIAAQSWTAMMMLVLCRGPRRRWLGAGGGSRSRGGAAQSRALAPVDLAARPAPVRARARVSPRSGRTRARAALALSGRVRVELFGSTGAGKTTTARRVIAARTLAQRAALFVLDQKGDDEDVAQMKRLAAAAGVPFILLDSQDPGTDRWQPLWGTPDGVAARVVEPIRQSEPYYYDTLRRHLDIVCRVLHAADRWPPSVPFLIDCCQPLRYPSVLAIAEQLGAQHSRLTRRTLEHGRYVHSPQGIKDLSGATNRLEVALALAGRQLVTPRVTSDGQAVAVRLVEALQQRAVVMWRTHADTMRDEAAALSVLALADLHDAAETADAPWTLLLDEVGAVIKMAAARGVAILQRGRSHRGQVIVITQSAADPATIQAWQQGAGGEIATARELARRLRRSVVIVIHDRRIPGRGRANIDHLTVGRGGVTVIDTKSSRGDVQITTAGLFHRREQLLVNGRDRTASSTRSSGRSPLSPGRWIDAP
jgi:hypothetical protein